jgi:hypothetical protein
LASAIEVAEAIYFCKTEAVIFLQVRCDLKKHRHPKASTNSPKIWDVEAFDGASPFLKPATREMLFLKAI